MATVIVDWIRLRDALAVGLPPSASAVANELVGCIRSGRVINASKIHELQPDEQILIVGLVAGARAAIASSRAGH